MERVVLQRIEGRLGSRIALLGSAVLLGVWIAASVSWVRRERESIDRAPAEAAKYLRKAVVFDLRLEVMKAAERVDWRASTIEPAVEPPIAARDASDAAAPARRRRRAVEASLSADTTVTAAWLREADGWMTWSAGGVPSLHRRPPYEGSCTVTRDDGRMFVAACREVEVVAAAGDLDGGASPDRFFQGGAVEVKPQTTTGTWAIYLAVPPEARVFQSASWPEVVLPQRMLGTRDPGDVREADAMLAGKRVRFEAARVPGLPFTVVTAVPRPPELRVDDLLRGDAGPSTAAWQQWLVVSGSAAAGGMLFFLLLGLSINRAFAPVLDAVERLRLGRIDVAVDVDRSDEIGALAAMLNRLAGSLRATRRDLEREARVAAWRDVARGLAHEIKNPLMPIRGTVENLLRWRREEPERFDRLVEARLETVLDEVSNLTRLAGTFSDFAKLPAPVREPSDLNVLARDVAAMHAAGTEVTVVDELDAGLAPVPFDRGQFRQVVTNVVKNAIEAMGGRGRLTLRSGSGAGRHWLSIDDTGPGADDATLARLFTPYHTTKKAQGGTGLGLFLAQRIIVEHQGTIEAARAPSGGLRVTISLPSGDGEGA